MEDVKFNSAEKEQPTKKNGFRRFLQWFIFISIVVISFLIYWFYYNVMSDGSRTVYLVKVSHKGNIFKTYEGEALVSIGVSPQTSITADKFIYSVTSKALYDSLTKYEGQKMMLKYHQYRKTLPWRGESDYVVYGIGRPAF